MNHGVSKQFAITISDKEKIEFKLKNNIPLDKILVNAQRMIDEGASVLDIGGESTRPGARPVSVDEELDRVLAEIYLLRRDSRTRPYISAIET
mgnify:CR=1 FL=1